MTARLPAGERGAVSIMMAVLGIGIIAALGLVVDGGRALQALVEAQDLADDAARAGAQAVDLEDWRASGRPVILDDAVVGAAVAEFMTHNVYEDPVGWRLVPPTGPDADTSVAVEVTISTRSFLFGSRTMTAVGTANALDGVTGP